MAGIEMKKEYFALRDAPIPSTRASDIVAPDRESPGKMAAPCMAPMANASKKSILSGSGLWRKRRLLTSRNAVRIRYAIPTLRKVTPVSTVSWNQYPMKNVGTLDTSNNSISRRPHAPS
jgi:hypothetical protein